MIAKHQFNHHHAYQERIKCTMFDHILFFATHTKQQAQSINFRSKNTKMRFCSFAFYLKRFVWKSFECREKKIYGCHPSVINRNEAFFFFFIFFCRIQFSYCVLFHRRMRYSETQRGIKELRRVNINRYMYAILQKNYTLCALFAYAVYRCFKLKLAHCATLNEICEQINGC